MKFTLKEWNEIDKLVWEALRTTELKIKEIREDATVEGAEWPNEKKLADNVEYSVLTMRHEVLDAIRTKIKTEEF
jgi:hypothetical protein